jgi:hypothetical protein
MLRAVLGAYSDVELCCEDGIVVKANAFTMIAACEILRLLYEDVGHMQTIPLPTLEASTAQITVDVIHGIRTLSELSLDEVEKCCAGFDYLGCTILGKKLLARIWHFVSKTEDPLILFKFADRLLVSETYARDVLNKLKSLAPFWKDFKKVFDHVTMTEDIALLCMWRLSKYFPAHLIFEALIDAIPEHVLSFDMCIKVMGCYRSGKYHHPDELVMSSNKILSKFKDEDRAIHLQAISDAFCMYDVSPSGSKLIGTTLTFSNEPKTSVLIKVYDPFKGTRLLRVKRFLIASVNTLEGTIGGTCDIEKLDETRHYPSTLLMRVTAYNATTPHQHDTIDASYAITEVWREFNFLEYGEVTQLEHPTLRDSEREAQLSNALTSVDTLRYIRLDFFYGHGDIRKLSIF